MSANGPTFYKDPAIAVVCSFLACGLGHVYAGEYGKGFVLMVAYAVAWMLTTVLVGFVLVPVLWLYGMWSAHRAAIAHNERLSAGA